MPNRLFLIASKVFIGSLNLDPRAVVHNTEIGVVFESTEIGSGMGEWFDENIDMLAFRLELRKGQERNRTHYLARCGEWETDRFRYRPLHRFLAAIRCRLHGPAADRITTLTAD